MKKGKKRVSALAIVFVTILLLAVVFTYFLINNLKEPIDKTIAGTETHYELVSERLDIPWELVFLPSGDLLVTERLGNLLRVGIDKKIIPVSGVEHKGEGGLLGIALHPNFENNHFIYLYSTTALGNGLENRVDRYVFDSENNVLTNKKPIISGIPGASYHDGGRLAFGPDGYLYITTGDSGNPLLAQDKNSLAGKILRLEENGNIPPDNPFGNAVYSYGHRNSQGITWDENGRLWATEHGTVNMDELNLIEKGKNYGWNLIEGDEKREGMQTPIINSGTDSVWAPTGITYYNGNLLFTGLKGEALYKYDITTNKITPYFQGEFGRLRTVSVKDGYIYLLTNNKDGRGNPSIDDDRIIKIPISEIN